MDNTILTFISFTGRTSWLVRDEESALFYLPGDEMMCAWQLERILTDQVFAERLSHNACFIALVRNNPDAVVTNQLEIYIRTINEGNYPNEK